MLHNRSQIVLLLTFLVFSLAVAAEDATEEEPPQCSEPSQTQTSSSDSEDDDDDDSGEEGLPIEEEPPCVPPLEFEPTEETDQANETESTDEAEPTQLSLDESDEHSTDLVARPGT